MPLKTPNIYLTAVSCYHNGLAAIDAAIG